MVDPTMERPARKTDGETALGLGRGTGRFEGWYLRKFVLVGCRCAGGSEEAYARRLEEKREVERERWDVENVVIVDR
jgi:hypothetical protein